MATIREEITKLLQSASDDEFTDFLYYYSSKLDDFADMFCTKYEEDEDGGCKWSHQYGCRSCICVWIASEANPGDAKKIRNKLFGEEE